MRASMARRGRRTALALFLMLSTAGIGSPPAATGMELVSVNTHDVSGNANSSGVTVNSDGSFVGFYSDATDLVVPDTNDVRDVFRRDRTVPETEFSSVNNMDQQGNLPSQPGNDSPSINGDGQIVAFDSAATNLVPQDTNGHVDVFVREHTGDTTTTEIVSVSSGVVGAPGTVQGNGDSRNPSIDGAGDLVAFQSRATNLVTDDTNNLDDIFVRNRTTNQTERICDTIQPNGNSSSPAISANGNVVAFTSAATNLGPVDQNGHLDIYTCDRTTGMYDLVSVSSGDYAAGEAVQGDADSLLAAISEDGRFVAFKSAADNLVPNDHNGLFDVFVRDRVAHTTERVSVNFLGGDSNDVSYPPSISYDGRFVAFGSAANNLTRDDFNGLSSVFVRDRNAGLTKLVDVNDAGQQANGGTPDVPPSVSGDGTKIGFVSYATNLTANTIQGGTISNVFIQNNPFPTDTPTPTPTPGPNDCCQCSGPACQVPTDGTCPTDCGIVPQAACLANGNCATFTPTPPPGPNDCCQCSGPACQVPTDGTCPTDCGIVFQAACLANGNCATFTPTPTPGPNDCCQCSGPACQVPTNGTCPTDCGIVLQAACLANGNCATFTPTPTPGPNDCCQCSGPACQAPNNGACPTDCGIVPQAACLASGNCATFTRTPTLTATPTFTTPPAAPTHTPTITASQTPTVTLTASQTATVTRTASQTPTVTATSTVTATVTASVTPTPSNHDVDACHCTVTPGGPRSTRGALVWLSGVLAVWLRRRRSTTHRRGAGARLGLGLAFLLAILSASRAAHAEGVPFVGVDTGASEPTNPNYRAQVRTGLIVKPYAGYMFTDNLGVQGDWHIAYQAPDYHNDRDINRNGQETAWMGWTLGPRFSLPIADLFEAYATFQGGAFTGLSGRLSHTGAGFSTGPGVNYNLTPALGIGLFARYDYAWLKPSPHDLGPDQTTAERYAQNIQWVEAGIGLRYSFLPEAVAAAPPPPPPPPPQPPPPPVVKKKKRIVLRAVHFDSNKATLRPDASPILDEAIDLLKKENAAVNVVAVGHTDAVEKSSVALSQRRANVVREYLITHGLDGRNVTAKGVGKSHPVATNKTEKGRAENRRVELRIE